MVVTVQYVIHVVEACDQEVILAGDYYYHKILNSRLNYECINAKSSRKTVGEKSSIILLQHRKS